MKCRRLPAEWGRLAHLFDDINEAFIDYDEQVAFLLACRERLSPQATRALDLGCGTGQHARQLAGRGLRVVGVDFSPQLLEVAARQAKGLKPPPRFVCGDITSVPLRRRYDLVYGLNFVFSYLPTNEELRAALAEARRLLSPRGVFVMDYHYFFPATADNKLAQRWQERCRARGQELVVIHSPVVDWETQLCTDAMLYRFREGKQTTREVESREVRRISLPQDLRLILELSGFDILAHCARWDLDSEPHSGLGVFVARRGPR